MWECVALTGACIFFVAIVASILSIRRVLVLEPAAVFRDERLGAGRSRRGLPRRPQALR